jgi:hypothetical protein
MLSSLPLLLLSASLVFLPLTHAGGWPDHDCLTKAEASDIAGRWLALHSQDPTAPAWTELATSTLATDVTVEDETVNFFFFPTIVSGRTS